MQYSASHVATTALLLFQNDLRSNLRASNFKKFPGGACPKTSLVLHACLLLHAYIHIRHPGQLGQPIGIFFNLQGTGWDATHSWSTDVSSHTMVQKISWPFHSLSLNLIPTTHSFCISNVLCLQCLQSHFLVPYQFQRGQEQACSKGFLLFSAAVPLNLPNLRISST